MPNSHTHVSRLELLIVLHYLLKYSDEKHLPQQKDYVDFAKKTYKKTIRRQRINEILNFLVKTKKKFPNLLPFEILEHSTGSKKKYYAGRKYLKDEEVGQLIGSVMHNRYLLEEEEAPLIRTLLQLTKSEHEIESFETLARLKNKKVPKIHPRVIGLMKQLDGALNQRALVEFNLLAKEKNIEHVKSSISQLMKGYVYKLIDQNDHPYLLLVNLKTQLLESYRISRITNLRITSIYDDVQDAPPLETHLKPMLVLTNYLKEAVNPEPDGTIQTITFRFIHSKFNEVTIAESFKAYFKQPMGMIRKEITIPNADEGGAITIQQMTVKIQVNSFVFMKWATQYEIARLIEVVGPQSVRTALRTHYQHLSEYLDINP